MLLSLLLNLTNAGCRSTLLRKYRPHYTYFSFLPPFGVLYPHRDCNLISTKESILQHLPLQNTTSREGRSRKSSPQGQERRDHSHLLGEPAWELWASPKSIFPCRLYICSPNCSPADCQHLGEVAHISSLQREYLSAQKPTLPLSSCIS